MAKSLIMNFRETSPEGMNDGQTRYFFPGMDVEGDGIAAFQVSFPADGVIRNLRYHVASNSIAGAGDSTFDVLVNNVAVIETTFESGETGLIQDATEVEVSAGDTFIYRGVGGGTSGTCAIRAILLEYEPTDTSKTYTLLVANSSGSIARVADGDTYLAVAGARIGDPTETTLQYRCPIDATAMYFGAAIGTVAATGGTSTYTLRIGAADPTDGPEVTAGTADDNTLQLDNTNTADISAGDLLSVKWNINGSTGGANNVEKIFVWLESTNNEFVLVNMDRKGERGFDNNTYYYALGGSFIPAPGAAQTACEIPFPFAFTLSKLHVIDSQTSGALVGHTVTVLDDDGAATELAVTYQLADSGTWVVSDTESYDVEADTAASYEIDMPLGGAYRDWDCFGVVCTVAAAASVSTTPVAPIARNRALNFR